MSDRPTLAEMLPMLRAAYPKLTAEGLEEHASNVLVCEDPFWHRLLAERDRHAAEAVGAAFKAVLEFVGRNCNAADARPTSRYLAAAFYEAEIARIQAEIAPNASLALSARLAQARNEAIEEAAELATQCYGVHGFDDDMELAKAIRALKTPAEEG